MQLDALQRAGVDHIYEETRSAVRSRPVLDAMLGDLVPGDQVVVYKLDRLARSMTHFVRVFDHLKVKRVAFRSLTEAVDTETVQGRMFLNLLGVFAEFERELIRERCMAGQRAARERGRTWGRPAAFNREESAALVDLWRGGWADQPRLADMFGVSVGCLRDAIHKHEMRGRWATKK
ncbi:MAG: hypothetical protein RL211_2275 [Pseudomonadota bacterium]|jgi:DNA invertase Pin-like site-specific DNA recombinase